MGTSQWLWLLEGRAVSRVLTGNKQGDQKDTDVSFDPRDCDLIDLRENLGIQNLRKRFPLTFQRRSSSLKAAAEAMKPVCAFESGTETHELLSSRLLSPIWKSQFSHLLEIHF